MQTHAEIIGEPQTRDGYPAGVPCWVDTVQPDPEAAMAFYGALFGWEFEEQGRYVLALLDGRAVAAIAAQPRGGIAAWNTYIRVDDTDATAAKVWAAGGRVVDGPFTVGSAGRMAAFADPSGAAFRVWQPRAHGGAQLTGAPGSWNRSTLSTADVRTARAFYRRAFGWQAGDLDAVLAPRTGRRAAHWGVEFAVADVAAAAERTAELGGRVMLAPSDAGALLRDPQGAEFAVIV